MPNPFTFDTTLFLAVLVFFVFMLLDDSELDEDKLLSNFLFGARFITTSVFILLSTFLSRDVTGGWSDEFDEGDEENF